MQRARCYLLGETAVVLELEPPVTLATQKRIWRLAQRLPELPGVVEAIPGMNNITVVLRDPHTGALDAIERLETRPVDRLFTGIPVRGLASTLYLHPEPFVCEGEMYLLGTVLSHFLSLYASVNSFHMLTVVNTESQETWKWTERIGQHPLI